MNTVRHKPQYSETLERDLRDFVVDVVLKPLGDTLDNASGDDALVAAIRAGKVTHDGVRWKGDFNIAVSRRIRELGGTSTPLAEIPADIRQEITDANQRFAVRRTALLALLAGIAVAQGAVPEPATDAVALVVGDAVDQFAPPAGKQEAVASTAPVVTKASSELFVAARGYLVLKAIEEAQKTVTEARSEAELSELMLLLEDKVARRTTLVADQLASRVVAEVRQAVAVAAGAEEYRWVTMRDSRVRHDHSILDGRVFRFDSPPIVDTATGRRANPGEDYNCRCFAVPILPE